MKLHVVDAFTNRPFSGNPAAVCILDQAMDADRMQLIAREMNLAETAFVQPIDDGFSLRWFTPKVEVKLCGHATLASAFVLWNLGLLDSNQTARFSTLSGWLTCQRKSDWIEMDFPSHPATACSAPSQLVTGLGCKAAWIGDSGMDILVEVADEATVRGIQPNMSMLATIPTRGIIVTSRSATSGIDFVSRFFAPAVGVDEDPVTGSAHCTLGPYWQSKLRRSDLVGFQASDRGGTVQVSVRNERTLLRGQAVLMSRVELLV